MILALVIAGSMLFGMSCAGLWWRGMRRRERAARRRDALKAEFLDKQLWQFISLEEWLASSEAAKEGK